MGLTGLDVDAAAEDDTGIGGASLSRDYEAAKKAAGLPSDSRASQPKYLQVGRGKGLSGLLGSSIYAARFKLDALTNELLEPLSDLLGKKDYLFEGDKPSSLDCLAFGYLSLMFYPGVPQAWLKEAIQTRFPRLMSYIWRMREELFGGEDVKAADVWSISGSEESEDRIESALHRLGLRLPWRPAPRRTIARVAMKVTREVTSSISFVSSFSRPHIHHSSSRQKESVVSQLPSPILVRSILGLSTVAAAALAGVAINQRRNPRHGDLVLWALRPAMGLNSFGQAGDFLSVFANQLPR